VRRSKAIDATAAVVKRTAHKNAKSEDVRRSKAIATE
jgi:hypothetical protein